ncbi:MAG: sensor histidine kinase [Phycisphaeraceae bacterium]|nr:sensor histidine kinase [Phycisphaeraceae bacterium]
MNTPISWIRRPSAQPFRTFAIVLAFVALIECLIMLLFGVVLSGNRHPIAEAAIDTTLLTIMLAPTLWFAIVRPIQRLSASRGLLLSQLFDAQEQERARIARDLHDELGQQLTAILVSLRTVEQAESLPVAHSRAKTAAESAAAALGEVRRISRGLRPIVLEDLGLIPAVEHLCEETQANHGIRIELAVELKPDERFPAATEVCIFRVLQESLTNCVRHAQATHVRAVLSRDAETLSLTVRDDGKGFDATRPFGPSFGLHGMRERVELLDGRYDIESVRGKGTAVRVVLPLSGSLP